MFVEAYHITYVTSSVTLPYPLVDSGTPATEEEKSGGDRKKSYFEFKVPRTTDEADSKKNFVVQTIEVDGPLEYDFGRVLDLINSGFFEDDDGDGGGAGGEGKHSTADSRFTSEFPIVLPPSSV